MVGVRGEEGEYLGTRGVRFHIFPGSPLRRRKPRWVMAANIVETSRVFARRVAEIEPMWVEAAAPHLLKREYLEPDWDEAREEVVARERVSFLGLVLSSKRVVNYGPIAPEESRFIFAREALVYQRLQRRPDWLLANDAAIRAAQCLEERLRVRSLLQPPESFVEHYAAILPRQVSSAATLEYFTRHLSAAERSALSLTDEQIFMRLPDAAALAQFPESAAVNGLSVPVEYRFSPGEAGDGATLRLPLLALPSITQAAVDAAIPGLLAPRIEALLRTLPKEARRGLIPMAPTVAQAVTSLGAASANLERLAQWLHEARGIAVASIRFDTAQLPEHLVTRAAVIEEGRVVASGAELADLRRRCALLSRAELDRRAQAAYPSPWHRFEANELPEKATLELSEGTVEVFPALARVRDRVEIRFEWSAEEAALAFRQGAVQLARSVLTRQERDLAKHIAANAPLLLSAAPYLQGNALADVLLALSFRRACFGEQDPPRTKAAFDAAVEAGRAELQPALEQVMALVAAWFAEARAVRRLLDDPRARAHAAAVQETSAHLERLLSAAFIEPLGADWLRQFPRYLKAEERRWQRVLARGGESPQTLRELEEWTARYRALEMQVGAELRRLPQLDEMRLWIEEYRVSLYAQELKTLGPVSATRLQQRATEIAAWLAR
jgi:ATP-dependent helicase HrpA